MTSKLEHALAHMRAGWAVLPVWSTSGARCACPMGASCHSPGKHPINMRGLTDASRSEAQIRAWWTEYPDANVGATLRGSGFIAFDVDIYKGDAEKLRAMEQSLGALPETRVHRSGSGEGLHVIYRAPREPDGQYVEIRGSIGPQSDRQVTMRARAYIVMPGSVHKSGQLYELSDDRPPAELPAAWVDALRRPMVGDGSVGVPPRELEPDWLRAIPDVDRVAHMREHLSRERGEVKGRGRPGEAYNVARTCARGFAVREPRDVLRAFTEIYNPRCSPPYSIGDVGRRIDSAYEQAEAPEWGARLKPLAVSRAELGMVDAPQMVEPDEVTPPLSSTAPSTIADEWPSDRPAAAPSDPDAWPSDLPGWGGAAGTDPFAAADESGERGPGASFLAGAAASFPPVPPRVKVGKRARLHIPSIVEEARLPVVPTFYKKLNAKIGGGLTVHSHTLIVASSGKGKSSLAGELAAEHARNAPCIVYVGEMTGPLWLARVIGQRLERSWSDVLRGQVSVEDMHNALDGLQIYPVARQEDPIAGVRATVEHAMQEQGAIPDPNRPGSWVSAETGQPSHLVPMIVIDYIQLLADVERDMRVSMIAAIRELQQYIEDTVVVGISLSQTSRDGGRRIREGSQNAEELGDTGAETAELERGATNQIVLSYTSKDDVEEHEVTVTITKARFGGGSKLGMRFNGRTGRWTEMDAPPLSEEDSDRIGEILSQISIHEAHKCMAGAGCMGSINPRALSQRGSVHKVDATRPQVERLLRVLEDQKRVVRKAGCYFLAGGVAQSDTPS